MLAPPFGPKRNNLRRPGTDNGKSVLITGGAGFIGSHLCDRLLQKGKRVLCVDNLYTGRLSNIRPLLNHPNFTSSSTTSLNRSSSLRPWTTSTISPARLRRAITSAIRSAR
jgi:NAD(P)-dependent dehydrogenase (short-subunit alcohol dehydrogenase family)